jgi:hypothetical protein
MTTITSAASRRIRTARSLFVTAATAALLAGAFGGVAAAEDARVNSMSFDIQSPYQGAVITVVSTNNGSSWNEIVRGAKISFNAIMQVDTAHPGYVDRLGVFLGKCTNTECANHTRVFVATPASRDYNASKMINVSLEQLIDSAPNAFSAKNYKQQILDLCNNGRSDAKTPHQELLSVDASFSVNTRKGISIDPTEVSQDGQVAFNGGDHTLHDSFLVVIRCEATRESERPEKEPKRVPPVAKNEIDLFLSSYQVPQSGPRGTTCAPLKVTTRIGTGKAGAVNVKLWRQVNGGPITSETKQMHAAALGGNKFGDNWSKFEQFSKTTTVQYKAEMLDDTFAPSTPWKSITIHCNGDYAPPQSNANPDTSVPPRGRPQVELPPTVTPPPLCGTKAAKVRGSAPCIKVAPLPDKRKQWAEQKRKEAAAKAAELRRREAALKVANARQQEALRRQHELRRPMHFGRVGMFGGGLRRGFFR